MGKWKTGILTVDLTSMGGSGLKKGQNVRYNKIQTVPDVDGIRLTKYEYYYTDMNGKGLVRTTSLTIEGQPEIKEPFI